MAGIFSKNCILSNSIDYYCLVCGEQFGTEENTLAHILDSQHKGNLKSCAYLEKYGKQLIRKTKGVYFCERCALTFPTATKVDLHVAEESHISAEFKQEIKRVNNEIIAFDKYHIAADAWNGFIEDTCVICSTEFDDYVSHKSSRSHILNLIKSDVAIFAGAVYRKIDSKSNQCLTCNTIFGENLYDHFGSSSHKVVLKLYEETGTNGIENHNSFPNNNNKSKLSESVDNYQNNNVNIDLINETAVCKKCSKNIDFNTDAIEKHIEEHKKTSVKTQEKVMPLATGNKTNGSDGTTLYTTPVSLGSGKKAGSHPNASTKKPGSHPFSSGKKSGWQPIVFPKKSGSHPNASAKNPGSHPIASAKRAEEFASQHGLTHNRADKSFYCKICCRRVPANLEDLEKHVASSIHKDNKEQEGSINQIAIKAPVKEPLFESITSYETVETRDEVINIINNKHWINAFGFYLIAKFNLKIFCHACNIDLVEDNVLDHMITDTHRDIVTKCLWITSLEDEFIREINLDVYHCGYCNGVEYNWDDILEHIELEEHKGNKLKAKQSLRNHVPNPFHRVTSTDMQRMLILFNKYAKR